VATFSGKRSKAQSETGYKHGTHIGNRALNRFFKPVH